MSTEEDSIPSLWLGILYPASFQGFMCARRFYSCVQGRQGLSGPRRRKCMSGKHLRNMCRFRHPVTIANKRHVALCLIQP
jgi:hypothetical protein